MPDYRQTDLDEARQLAPNENPKAQERIARALARRERLGAEKLRREPVVPLLRVVVKDSEVTRG